MMNTPILFLIFNRPDTTEQVFDSIRQIRPTRLYVAADGPRSHKAGEKELCDRTRKIIEKVDWPCKVITLFRDSNLGCKQAVSSAITWFFEHEEEGIILEDDCLPDPSFFGYCQSLLEKYRHDTRIMQISGINIQFGQKRGNASYYFSHYNYIWGWASWRRAWKYYDVNMSLYPEFKKNRYIYSIFKDKRIARFWEKILTDTYQNAINTWDYQWTFATWVQNGLSIVPNVNLVSNIGFGNQSSHTNDSNHPLAYIPTSPLQDIVHPDYILVDEAADQFAIDKVIFPPLMIILLRKYLKIRWPFLIR